MNTHATCPNYAGQWFHKSTGACSCGDSHAGYCAGLGVGHIWTAVDCPAYRTLDGADCTCNSFREEG